MSWVDKNGYLDVKSCEGIEKYLLSKTQIKPQVYRTDRYLYIVYTKSNQTYISKIEIPAGVLYCLKEKDFEEVIELMNSTVQPN